MERVNQKPYKYLKRTETSAPARFSDRHNAPRRAFVITLSGEAELGFGDYCVFWAGHEAHEVRSRRRIMRDGHYLLR